MKEDRIKAERLREECLMYFRERPVFGKLLRGFREKYLSYGRFAGTVTLKNLKESEREDLEGFLLRSYHGKKSASVSAERFEKALSESRFAGISGKDVLELYFRETVEGRKEQRQREDRQWMALLDRAKKGAGTLAARWINEITEMLRGGISEIQRGGIIESGRGKAESCRETAECRRGSEADAAKEVSRFLSYLKKRDREAGGNLDEAERLLMLGVQVLSNLPAEKEPETTVARATGDRTGSSGKSGKKESDPFGKSVRYLAVFAAEITGNPHAFDTGTKDGKYLEMLVEWYVRRLETKDGANREHGGKNSLDRGFPAFRKQRLYLKAGLLQDDVSNYALAAGIRAKTRSGKLHAGMEGFLEEGEPVQIPLSAIAGWKSASCPGNRMYIVENPSVYAVLCGKWNRKFGLMCMNGQPRFSSLLLLDLLAESGTEVWYAGDIDPEGLLIAQRLKRYYQGEFYYWHMSADDYEMCMSAEPITQRRQKMLEKVQDPELKTTAETLQKSGKAGYQENMLRVYLEIFPRDERKGFFSEL